jgi:replicative DNA helicase
LRYPEKEKPPASIRTRASDMEGRIMSETTQSYDSAYCTPETERRVLTTLANSPYPAESAIGWDASLFTIPGANELLDQLRAAVAPMTAPYDVPLFDARELRTARDDLVSLATVRQFEPAWAHAAQEIRAGKATQETLSILASAIRLAQQSASVQTHTATLAEIASNYYQETALWSRAAATGFDNLDRYLGGGLLPGRLTALLGAPGMGKTAFAFQMAEVIASSGRPVVYVTSEDSPHMLLCRTMARYSNLDYTGLLRGYYAESQTASALLDLSDRTSSQRLLLIDSSHGAFSLDSVVERARLHFKRYSADGHGVLILDYLQRLVRASQLSTDIDLRQRVTAFTEQLRSVATELGCSLVVLSAQGRQSYSGGASDKSALASAKESGDVEYTCDVLLALVEGADEPVPPQGTPAKPIVLRLDKNRQGPSGQSVKLAFDRVHQRFSEARQ